MLQSLTVLVVEQAEEYEKLLVENVVDEDVRNAFSVCMGIIYGPSDGFNLSVSLSVAGGGQ